MSRPENWTGERLETFVFDQTAMEHLHRYAIALEYAEGKQVLDIACGEGYGAHLLAKKAAHVTGVDIDKPTVEKAKNKYQSENLVFQTGSVLDTRGEQQYDLITCFETLEHVNDHELVLRSLKNSLKPGGILLVSTPNKKNYSDTNGYKNPFHQKELYKEEFQTLLGTFFKHITLLNQQLTYSSVIVPAEPAPLKMYTGDFQHIQTTAFPEPAYFLAVVSDDPIPAIGGSFFAGEPILDLALEKRENIVKGTLSYRIGHGLLYPFKLVRGLFVNKRK